MLHLEFQMLATFRPKGWTIAARLRTEQRWLPLVEGVFHRVRGQLRLIRPMRQGSPWSIAFAEEVAVGLSSPFGGPRRGFDRSRLTAAVVRQIRPAVALESGYTWEAINRVLLPYRHNHILSMGVLTRFGW